MLLVVWTLLVIMASAESAENNIGLVEGAEGMYAESCEEYIESDFFSDNRYNGLQPWVGKPFDGFDDGEWRVKTRKRKRRDTGSVDIETFSKMSTDEKLLALFSKLSVVENKQSQLNAVMSPFHEKLESLEKCVNVQNQKLKMLAYRSIDLEARSRRNNLVFRGLADCNYENCKDVIVNFLSGELKIDISQAHIARAHRLGSLARSRAKYTVTRRPMIVAFNDYSITEMIMQAAKNLNGTFFRIERDFPVEITEARQRLWPKFKTERENYPSSRVTIGYQAKIIRNGRVTHDEFPDWYDVLHCSRVRGFEINETTGKESRRKPFRPWQAQAQTATLSQDGSQIDIDTDTDSDSATQPPTHTVPSKEFEEKSKQQSCAAESARKVNDSRGNNDTNKNNSQLANALPQRITREAARNQKENRNESRSAHQRTSSLPDLTCGNSTARSNKNRQPSNNSQPISDSQARVSEKAMNGQPSVVNKSK